MSQVYNPNNHMFVKRDKEGKFVAAKATPYKNLELQTGTKSKGVKPDNKNDGVKKTGK